MKEKSATILSWIFTIYTCFASAHTAYVLSSALSTYADLYAGLGAKLPLLTRMILSLAHRPLYIAATIFVVFLICKEIFSKSSTTRVIATCVVLIALDLIKSLAIGSMYLPLVQLLSDIK